jgi:glycine oxidase
VSTSTHDVVVAGGGPVGLACAWSAARRGLSVRVVDAGGPGAWEVAAGMLAPVSETEPGDDALAVLGIRAVERFGGFVAELGEDVGYRAAGTLTVARDRDEAEALERVLAFRTELGLPVERLRPSQARRLEPALAPTVRLALHAADDHAVDPRRLVAALRRALGGAVARGRAERLLVRDGRAAGVALAGGEEVRAAQVVLATGATTIDGVPPDARVPVRPVKGQVLRLRDPRENHPHPPLVERTIRGPDAYLVPRGDGDYVLGATMEERGWDTAPTAGAVYELLRDMGELVPGILELEIAELRAGLRPATPDNLPAIGGSALDGLLWATGHFRNGILLAPVTGELVAGALAGEPLPEWAALADPRRFGRGEAEGAAGDDARRAEAEVPA